MCHHFIKVCKKTTKLSSSDERKLIGVHPENHRVTKAQACHKWEITGTPASLSTVERVLYNLEWERADQESLKLTKICRYPHGQIKVKSSEENVSCFTWDKNKDTIVTMTRDMFEGVKMRLSNLYQHCNNWWWCSAPVLVAVVLVYTGIHKMNGIMREEDYLQLLQLRSTARWLKFGYKWVFQEDNDPKGNYKMVLAWIKQANTKLLKCSSPSTDLKPFWKFMDCA